MISLLILSIISLFLGPVLLQVAGHRKGAIRFLDSFVLFSVFGLVAFHILPESIADAGMWAGLAAAVGLFGPILAGPYLKTGECNLNSSLVSAASLGLIAHAILDGAAISMASYEAGTGEFLLAVAILLHRLPEGVGVWRVASTYYSSKVGIAALAVLTVAVSLGFFFGGQILNATSEQALMIFQSLMAGMLLHVIFHRHHLEPSEEAHHPEDCKHHHHPKKRWHKSSGLGALAGIGLVVVLLFIHPSEHDHHHAISGHEHIHGEDCQGEHT